MGAFRKVDAALDALDRFGNRLGDWLHDRLPESWRRPGRQPFTAGGWDRHSLTRAFAIILLTDVLLVAVAVGLFSRDEWWAVLLGVAACLIAGAVSLVFGREFVRRR